jgi:hypothetical protein
MVGNQDGVPAFFPRGSNAASIVLAVTPSSRDYYQFNILGENDEQHT